MSTARVYTCRAWLLVARARAFVKTVQMPHHVWEIIFCFYFKDVDSWRCTTQLSLCHSSSLRKGLDALVSHNDEALGECFSEHACGSILASTSSTCKLMEFTEYLLIYLIFQRPLPFSLSPVLCVCLLVLLLVADSLLRRTLHVVGRESKKDKLSKDGENKYQLSGCPLRLPAIVSPEESSTISYSP